MVTKLVVVLTTLIFSGAAVALPANFTGKYHILQSRPLALTNGGGFALQDGSLVADAAVDPSRPYCRAGQSSFDETKGNIDVTFQTASDGSEHAVLTTIPGSASARPTTVECIASNGFIGALDLSIAFGRVFEITK